MWYQTNKWSIFKAGETVEIINSKTYHIENIGRTKDAKIRVWVTKC